ncbi:MAG: hypothetical protein ACRD4A_03660 [Candidatus Acidiferrales bacterium]
MRKRIVVALAIILFSSIAFAKKKCPLSDAQLAEITARGRLLAQYDQAAWHSTDAVLATNPEKGSVTRYIANKTDSGWVVAFGRFNDAQNNFLVVYTATQEASPQQFVVKHYDPPQVDTGFYFLGAKATAAALKDFQGEKRPYNTAVLPAESGQMYVYVVPAQTVSDVYPLGGDVRYLISADGNRVVEKRQLHKAIMDRDFRNVARPEAGYHTHVLSNVPEDTDVFFVLSQKSPVPEYVGTKNQIYVIKIDGSIACTK